MGARGPAPKPTALRIVDGSKVRPKERERAAVGSEPQPTGAIPPAPPAELSEAAKAIWRETLDAVPAGLLRRLDLAVFTLYVRAFALYKDAARHVDEKGLVVLNGTQVIPNPFLSVMTKQALLMLKAADQMGFTPAARTRIAITHGNSGAGTPTGNPFAAHGIRPPKS